jgi:hypothetical protein
LKSAIEQFPRSEIGFPVSSTVLAAQMPAHCRELSDACRPALLHDINVYNISSPAGNTNGLNILLVDGITGTLKEAKKMRRNI